MRSAWNAFAWRGCMSDDCVTWQKGVLQKIRKMQTVNHEKYLHGNR